MAATSQRPFIPVGSFIDQQGKGGQTAKKQAERHAHELSQNSDMKWKACKTKNGGYAVVRKA